MLSLKTTFYKMKLCNAVIFHELINRPEKYLKTSKLKNYSVHIFFLFLES